MEVPDDAYLDARDFSKEILPQAIHSLGDLIAAMGIARSSAAALRLGADFCGVAVAGANIVSLALLSTERLRLTYHSLPPYGLAYPVLDYVGSQRLEGSAAGLAITAKATICIGLDAPMPRDSTLADWLHYSTQMGAQSMVATPLTLCGEVIGALCVASKELSTAEGYAPLARTLAAVMAPYVGMLRYQNELKFVDQLLHQMIPQRVALRLKELQVQERRQQHQQQRHQQQRQQQQRQQQQRQQQQQQQQPQSARAATATNPSSSNSSSSSSTSAPPTPIAAAGSSIHHRHHSCHHSHAAQELWVPPCSSWRPSPSPSSFPSSSHRLEPSSPGRVAVAAEILRQHWRLCMRLVSPLWCLLQLPKVGGCKAETAEARLSASGGDSGSGSSSSSSSSSSNGISQLPCIPRPKLMYTFPKAETETAFKAVYHMRRSTLSDAVFLVLTLLSAASMCLLHAAALRPAAAVPRPWRYEVPLVLWGCVVAATFSQLCPGSLMSRVHCREPVVAAIRLLDVLAFVAELATPASAAAAAPARALARTDAAGSNSASSGVTPQLLQIALSSGAFTLLRQAVLTHLRICVELPVQWVACMLLALGTTFWSPGGPGLHGPQVCMQLLIGFILPTWLVYIGESKARTAFVAKVV